MASSSDRVVRGHPGAGLVLAARTAPIATRSYPEASSSAGIPRSMTPRLDGHTGRGCGDTRSAHALDDARFAAARRLHDNRECS